MGLSENAAVDLLLGTGTYKSRVIRRQGEELYLDAIPDLARERRSVAGVRVSVAWREEGVRHSQEAEIQDVLDPLQILLVRLLGEPFRHNQRDRLPVKVSLPLEYGLMRQGGRFYSTTLDLSTEGARFFSRFRLWRGLTLRIGLQLGQQWVSLTGEVIRCKSEAQQFQGRLQWETEVRFLDGYSDARRQLNRFVSRELIRNGG